MTDGDYDLIVVGAGSAGFSASITAAEQGARVALVGEGLIGGTCVNVGCVPSKTMIRAMETVHQARAAGRFDGIGGAVQVDDWRALVAQKDSLVDELRQAKYIDLLAPYDNIDYPNSRAWFTADRLAVGSADIRADRVFIAIGSKQQVPDIPGLAAIDYPTSTTALELETLPASMLIAGGGYIGFELAQIFARAGVEVTIVCRRGLLPGGRAGDQYGLGGGVQGRGHQCGRGRALSECRRGGGASSTCHGTVWPHAAACGRRIASGHGPVGQCGTFEP